MSLASAEKIGALFFAGAVQFAVSLRIAEALYPNYDVSRNVISDLGATCNPACTIYQPSSGILNSSLILFGALILLGVYLMMKELHRTPLVVMLLLSGIGVAGAGIFTETLLTLHGAFAFLAFFFSPIAAILSSRVLRAPFNIFSLVLGIVALVALGLFGSGTNLDWVTVGWRE